jgi:hypothetical protein|tara:strand:- start:4180 stop:11646 length:7467 start_codon:yes stop_codon:yes gene_type:complete
MSQKTNLNVSPYFDDFDANDDYHKILFKPGYPVQARELTGLQSILQNQVETFGQHFFKEGAKVIPGNTVYNSYYYAIELVNDYLGVPVAAYADQLVGLKITGETSGVTATVDKILLPEDSERGNLTLYVNYLGSNTSNNLEDTFADGESLIASAPITSGLLGNTAIEQGSPFAITKESDAASVGSSFTIFDGVYFIRGQFLNVRTETLILDQYSNLPNYRVGLFITEEVINADLDEDLNDNSQGFNNYAAPGADRLRITTRLFKKSLSDINDDNFIELATIIDGAIKIKPQTTDKSYLAAELARRTFAESGDYVVNPFDVSVKESLNDRKGNRGIHQDGQFTFGGSTPEEGLALYQVSPGKAFVKGYEIETTGPVFLDVEKPRTTKTLKNQSIIYNTGSTFKLNRVYGSPTVGIGNTFVLSLRDERVGSASTIAAGKEIGVARVYDFRLDSGAYSLSNGNINEWEISLFDLQTTTEVTLNYPVTYSTPTYVEGENSGATGYLFADVNDSEAITLYNTNGTFIPNESFIFNGISSGVIGVAVTAHGTTNVKSVHGVVGAAITFSADIVQTDRYIIGIATVSALTAGISTVTSLNPVFPGTLVKKNDLIKYTDTTLSDPVIAKVTTIGSNFVEVEQVESVTGITNSTLPSTNLQITDLTVLASYLDDSTDSTLYTKLPKNHVSNVDLSEASLTIRKEFTVNIANGELTAPVDAGTNETFLPFTSARYSLVRTDGSYEVLTSDKFSFASGGSQIQIYNLGSDDTGCTLITTLTKTKPTSKSKRKKRVNTLVIDKSKLQGSGIGATTLNDGLQYGNFPYGTRVQDDDICLNVPDIVEIHGIFESAGTSDAFAPKAILTSITTPSNTTTDLIIGEEFVGQTSGAVAICAGKISSTQVEFIYKNKNTFKEGETILFSESVSSAVISTLDAESFDVSSNYTFKTGQKGTIYDYGSISRKSDRVVPTKQLKVYFSTGYYEQSDDGDITICNSYQDFDYTKEIKTVNGHRNTDLIDIRPRVSEYSLTNATRSPFEFYGRSFNASGNSAANVLASDENIIASFSFFLGRIDRVCLTKNGIFQINYGSPSENPQKPTTVDDSIEIASIFLPPYLYDVANASIQFLEHKRYRMSDIRQLEKRIKNLEYYTSLSLLETNTANLLIPDSEGLSRFKSGFFVDNFTTLLAQDNAILYKNSIDIQNKELRPSHFTNALDLIPGPVTGIDPSADLAFTQPEGVNVVKKGDIVTLDYSNIEWKSQNFGTRVESVTPFILNFWRGSLQLNPASDTWVDTVRLEAKYINVEGNYARVFADAVQNLNVDPQTGFAPTVWNSWVANWTGQEQITTTRTRNQNVWLGWGIRNETLEDTLLEVIDTGIETRDGTRATFSEQIDNTSVGDRVVSRELIPFMRSRNIAFAGHGIKPNTRVYAYFDGVDVTQYCIPKLLEIEMVSGTFEVGETVDGGSGVIAGAPDRNASLNPSIIFRVAQLNHRNGPYNAPELTYPEDPYTLQPLGSQYSSSSTILNVDSFSLANIAQGQFSGYIEPGMPLVGRTSGAIANVRAIRLISDITATVKGSLFIPDPNVDIHPRFETGAKTFVLINDEDGDPDFATTSATEGFISSGTLETVQENIVSVRNGRVDLIEQTEQRDIRRTTGAQVVATTVISSRTWAFPPPPPPPPRRPPPPPPRRWDPIAQSFYVEESEGVFITRCGVYFNTVSTSNIPVVLQIRTMELGTPTQKVLPFSEIFLQPEQCTVSEDGTAVTYFEFDAPVYLKGGTEYSICMLSQSPDYSVFISRVGENDINTQAFVSNQPTLGSFFKSQNASTWEPSQWEDLKFTLDRADFIEDGTIEFYNPDLNRGNTQIARLLPDSLQMSSKEIRISLGSTISDPNLEFGNTVSQYGSNATGNYIDNAGIATGNLSVINAGIGYTPTSGGYTFSGVSLNTITGNGSGATADITINNGSVGVATIALTGNGYRAGDVLEIASIGAVNVGQNARLSVVSIANTNQIILNNVQGDFLTGAANTMRYTNSAGTAADLNTEIVGIGVTIDNITTVSDGLHIKVNHKNHGMYTGEDYVEISGAISDIRPTKLGVSYSADSTSALTVTDASRFSTFEGVGVGTTNPGYLKIGNEIIEYTSVSGNNIEGDILRGTNARTYPVGTPVFKYELNGISLKRINKTHYLGDVSTESYPITFDSYHIKIDTSTDGIDRSIENGYPKLYQKESKNTGGYSVDASQNIPFEVLTPIVQNLTVPGTSISAEVRTVTGKSLSGNEIPFVDNGFETIAPNSPNYLETPRIICSKINEQNKLDNVPESKSVNMRLSLGTTNSKLSPVIDTQRVSMIFTSNRVNSTITDYANDQRVSDINSDPTAFQYVSKEITLETQSTSLKMVMNAHINLYSDIRAFYAIGDNPNFTPIFTPFPGYDNLDFKNQIISPEASDGRPDSFVTPTSSLGFVPEELDYKEYTFTADNLPSFKSYRVKLVLTSTNQAYVPRVKDLRVIALA